MTWVRGKSDSPESFLYDWKRAMERTERRERSAEATRAATL